MGVLVTGGCGFIGSHIFDSLQQEGHKVVIADDFSTGYRQNVSCPDSSVKTVNITNQHNLDSLFSAFKPEVVVHCAAKAKLRESFDDPAGYVRTNVLGTVNVAEAAAKCGTKKIIYTSTGGACYGEPMINPVPENAFKNPQSPYGISKLAGEDWIKFFASKSGMDYLIFRFGNVYGPRDVPQNDRLVTLIIDALRKGKDFTIKGDGEQTRDLVYVKDVAETVARFASQDAPSNVYNLGIGEEISVNEVYQRIAKELGSERLPVYAPAVSGEVRKISLDISKAKRELGWNPSRFDKGLKETITWFKEN